MLARIVANANSIDEGSGGFVQLLLKLRAAVGGNWRTGPRSANQCEMYARVGTLDAHHQAWIILRELRKREIGMSTVAAQYAVFDIVGLEAHSAYVVGNPAKKSNITQHRAAHAVVDHPM